MEQRQEKKRTLDGMEISDSTMTSSAGSRRAGNAKLRGHDMSSSLALPSAQPPTFRVPNRPYSCDVESLSGPRMNPVRSAGQQQEHQQRHQYFNQTLMNQQWASGGGGGKTARARRTNASYQQLTSVIDDENGRDDSGHKRDCIEQRDEPKQPPMAVQEDFGLESNELELVKGLSKSPVVSVAAQSVRRIQDKPTHRYVNAPLTPCKNYRQYPNTQSTTDPVNTSYCTMQRSASQCDFQRSDVYNPVPITDLSAPNRLQKSSMNTYRYATAASDSNVSLKKASSSHDCGDGSSKRMECLPSSNYYSTSNVSVHQSRQPSDDEVAHLMVSSTSTPPSVDVVAGSKYGGNTTMTGRDYEPASLPIDRLAGPSHQHRTVGGSNVAAEASQRPPQATNSSCVPPPPPSSTFSSSSSSVGFKQQQKQGSLPSRNPNVQRSGTCSIAVTEPDEDKPLNNTSNKHDQKPLVTKAASQKPCQQQHHQSQQQQNTPRGSLRRGKAVDFTYYSGDSQSSSRSGHHLSTTGGSQSKEKLQSTTGRKGGNIFRKLIGGSGSSSKSTSAEETFLSSTSGAMTTGVGAGGGGSGRSGSAVGLGGLSTIVPDASSTSSRPDFSSDSCDFKYDERIRKRIFMHYDCLSICADARPLLSGTSRLKDINLNAATGASQASKPYSFLASGGTNGVQPKSPQGETPTSPLGMAGSGEEASSGGINAGEDRGDGKTNELVLSCPYFRNECGGEPIRYVSLSRDNYQHQQHQGTGCYNCQNGSGGHRYSLPIDEHLETWHRPPTAAEASVLENLSNVYLGGRLCAKRQPQLVIEHVDQGAFYYRHCFSGKAHQNYFGIDENLGPLAISVVRDKIEVADARRLGLTSPYLFRLIIRLSDSTTFRGAILEESLPSYQGVKESRDQQLLPPTQFMPQSPSGAPSSGIGMTGTPSGQSVGQTCSFTTSVTGGGGSGGGSSGGKIPIKELLELVIPEMQISCLRLALPVPRTEELLLKLDEQSVYTRYKVGVLYCRAQQSTEEQMYNNESSGSAFDEFLDVLGQRVRLKGFDKYKGGLDSKGDTTGSYSVYTTHQQYEVMFHVSTMLPFTPQNRQQLSRKRHIGNDIVTVIFQEPDALPFSPHTVRSHFQHVFIVVRAHSPNTDHVRYSVAVSRCKDVPRFGPQVPQGATFPKSKDFRDFLLTKIINAENAVHKSEKFAAMTARTRREFMRDLAENHVTSHTLESSASGKIASKILGGSKRKDRAKPKLYLDAFCRGAVVWDVQVLAQVEDFSLCRPVECNLGISTDNLVLVERSNNETLFCTPTLSIIGWTSHGNSLKLYYDHADVVILRTLDDDDSSEIQEIIRRLQAVSKGCETIEVILRRNAAGQLGFHIQQEGIVSEVEMYGPAWQAGLRQGSRLVEICKVSVATLTHERMLELLRTSVNVRVLVLPPLLEDGSPRRGCEDPYCPTVLGEETVLFNVGHVAGTPAGPVEHRRSMPLVKTTAPGAPGIVGRPAPPSYEIAVTRRPVHTTTSTFGVGQQHVGFTQSMTVEQSPEMRSMGGTDYGYESGSGIGPIYVSSTKSLDDIQNRRDRRHSDDIRCASADQGGVSKPVAGQEYTLSARTTSHYPPDDQTSHRQPPVITATVAGNGPLTDTLNSTGSTASSEMSTDSADAIRQRPIRPSDLKRRVDKANSDIQQRTAASTPVLERTVTDPCSSASAVNTTTDTTARAPPIPPKTYRQLQSSTHMQSSSSGLGSFGALSSVSSCSSSSSHLGVPGAVNTQPHGDRQRRCTAAVQENLIRLINELESAGEIEEAVIVSSALYRTLASAPDTGLTPTGQKPGPHSSQQRSDKHAILSPETERGVEWASLVDAATRAIEGMAQRAISSNSSPELSGYHLKLEAAAQRVKLLEEKVERLENELDKERDMKRSLEAEVVHLRDANKHLDEECKNAKAELRKFTEWFFVAVENSNGQQQVGPQAPPPPAGRLPADALSTVPSIAGISPKK